MKKIILSVIVLSTLFVSCKKDTVTTTPGSSATFTYASWTACSPSGVQTRTWTVSPSTSTATPPADSVSRTCTYVVPGVTYTYDAWTGDCTTDGVQTRTYTRDPVDSVNSFPPADSVRRFCPGALNNIVGTFMITADSVFVYDIATSTITTVYDVYTDTSFNPDATHDDTYTYGPAGTGTNFTYDEMGTIRPTGWGTNFYPLTGYTNWNIQNSTSLYYDADYWGRITKINSTMYELYYLFADDPTTPTTYYLQYTTFTKQ